MSREVQSTGVPDQLREVDEGKQRIAGEITVDQSQDPEISCTDMFRRFSTGIENMMNLKLPPLD